MFKINKYAQFDPNILSGSRVMRVFSNWPQPAEMMLCKPLSIKEGCYTCQWLDNVDMHFYAKLDQNIPCGSSVIWAFSVTANRLTDEQTGIVIIVQTKGSCNSVAWKFVSVMAWTMYNRLSINPHLSITCSCVVSARVKRNMSQCMRFPTMWYVRPGKPQISLHNPAVWSEPLLVAWVFYDC